MDVFALDFDGVLCDSAVECAVSAWRAGSAIWPDWKGSEPPIEAQNRFVELRPVIETGYQTILLMRMIQDGTRNEIIESGFVDRCEQMLESAEFTREELMHLFAQARDRWIRENLPDWLSHHRFYPQVFETFQEKLSQFPVFIITTKQERFVHELLRSRRAEIATNRLYGLDTGRKKEDILLELKSRPEFTGAKFHFVEDRLETLVRVRRHPELDDIQLYLVDWGYNTKGEREEAAQLKRTKVISAAEFMQV